MTMRKWIVAGCLVLTGLFATAAAAEIEGKPLSVPEQKKALDDIFSKQMKIRWLEAMVFTKKSGGMLKGESESYGMLKAEVPNLIWFEDRGDPKEKLSSDMSSVMLLDGQFLWELFPKIDDEPREAERRPWAIAAEEGRGLSLASLLLGRDVHTADELYEEFDVKGGFSGEGAEATYHFILNQKNQDDENSKKRMLEIWVRPGASLPWKVRSTKRVRVVTPGAKPGNDYRESVEERILEQVKTDQEGLARFPVETFVFPLSPDMLVLDPNGDEIDHGKLKKDLVDIRKRLVSDRKE